MFQLINCSQRNQPTLIHFIQVHSWSKIVVFCLHLQINLKVTMASTQNPLVDEFTYLTTAQPSNVSSSIHSDPIGQRLRHIADSLLMYVVPVIIVIGTIGNVLSFIVLVRKKMRSRSVYFYLMLLACADLAVLYLNAFKNWLRYTFGWELNHQSNAFCKFYWFAMAVSIHMSAWLVILVTFDRFMAVAFPLRAALVCTSRRAAISSLICFVIMAVYNGHLLWTVHLQYFNVDGVESVMCGPMSSSVFMNKAFNYMKCVTYSIIPFLSVLALNIAIIVKLKKTQFTSSEGDRKSTSQSTMSRTTSVENTREIARVTYMLLIVSFSWLFLSFPFTLYSIIPRSRDESSYTRAVFHLATVVCYIFLWMNHSINFFLYCLSGKKFRSEIYAQLCKHAFSRKLKQFKRNHASQRTLRTCVPRQELVAGSPEKEGKTPMLSTSI